jgi:adenylate kinase family enzyme
VPILGYDERLPSRPRRVVVAGTSGSGKTTMAGRIAAVLDVPCVEIDSLHHGEGWTPRPTFVVDVEAFSAGPAWVIEWQYDQVRPLLAERADLVVWLDLPRHVVMRQVVRRTVRRRVRREVLWNGNVEAPLRTVFTDPEHIIRWAWRTHHESEQRISALLAAEPDRPVVRLGSRREADQWLAGPLTAAR